MGKRFDEILPFVDPVPESLIQALRKESGKGSLAQLPIFAPEVPGNHAFRYALAGLADSLDPQTRPTFEGVFEIRKAFYQLGAHHPKDLFLDLGTIKTGKTLNDSAAAIREVLTWCHENELVPILFGGHSDFIFPVYQSLEGQNIPFNLTFIDRCLGLDPTISSSHNYHFLENILTVGSRNLFNISFLAFQSYFSGPDAFDLAEQLFFDAISLGSFRENSESVEPYLRDSDFIFFDLSAVRYSDSPGISVAFPNGLYAEEACLLAYYSGLSDRLPGFALYGFSPEHDLRNQSAHLCAQILWFFLEGAAKRSFDFPASGLHLLTEKVVAGLDGQEPISFFTSEKSGKWWVMITSPGGHKPIVVSCTAEDYAEALRGEVPTRFWKTFQKIS